MNEASREAEIEESRMPVHEPPGSEAIISESRSPAPVPTWTPLTATVSGPRFSSLSEADQGTVRKLHNNLGHPTAERLSRHMSAQGAKQELVVGAADYLCAPCAERQGPKKTTPGNLKEPMEFNDKISIDGFEWKGKNGIQVYVWHILDEATRFHLGLRTHRDNAHLTKMVKNTWVQWAANPRMIAHDEAGEFVTDEWKNFLQEQGIQPILSAAAWQRGRIERHGGIIQEMLNRIDHEKAIENIQQFDDVLRQCFHAKNTMAVTAGYSPEQAVLGKASKLPASVTSDEDLSSHLTSHGEDLASEKFRQHLELLRAAARAAFSRADNSEAIRRALAHQSRGVSHNWS